MVSRPEASPWWLAAGPPVELWIGEQRVDATPARLDTAALRDTHAGDGLTFVLPEVGGLEVVVQRVTSPAPGVRQLQGHLADPVEHYAVTLTLGPVFAFANVTTPAGVWIAEFEDGAGWIRPDDLSERLIDYGQTDVRLPPRSEGAG